MSRHLANLSELGYVAREGSSSDGRRAKVVLTAAGQRAYEQLFERITRLNAELLSVLDDAQMGMLDALLSQLQERADSLSAQHSSSGEDSETVLKELWGLWLGRPAK